MRLSKSLALGAAILIAASVAAGAYHVYEVLGHCDTEFLRDIPSPDNSIEAVIFSRDCDATTDFNTQISLVPKGEKFSVDDDPSVFVVQGRHDLTVRWLTTRQIEVIIPHDEKIYRQETRMRDIAISYR